jgi:hypothetical protein
MMVGGAMRFLPTHEQPAMHYPLAPLAPGDGSRRESRCAMRRTCQEGWSRPALAAAIIYPARRRPWPGRANCIMAAARTGNRAGLACSAAGPTGRISIPGVMMLSNPMTTTRPYRSAISRAGRYRHAVTGRYCCDRQVCDPAPVSACPRRQYRGNRNAPATAGCGAWVSACRKIYIDAAAPGRLADSLKGTGDARYLPQVLKDKVF